MEILIFYFKKRALKLSNFGQRYNK